MTYKIFRTKTLIYAYLNSASNPHKHCVFNEKGPSVWKVLDRTRSGVRTLDTLIKSQVLCQLS